MNLRPVNWQPVGGCPSIHLLIAVLLAALAAGSLGPHRTVAAKPSGELIPVPLAELPFIHDALRQRIHRIDRIMGGADYPAANTIGWSRRSNAGPDTRTGDDFVAQWSTATDRLGVSIQPGQEPASTVRVYADVDSKSAEFKGSPQICRFNLRGSWKPKAPGWSAMVVIFSHRSYTANAAGKETIRVHFRHSDTTTLNLPFDGWHAAMPMDPQLPPARGFKQTRISSPAADLSVAEARALTKSAESFRDEVIRILAAAEAQAIADILASRGMQRGTYRQVDSDGRMQFVASDPKDVEALSADEIALFRDIAEKDFQRRRSLVQENYLELHAAILKAFPLDQYVAGELIPAAP